MAAAMVGVVIHVGLRPCCGASLSLVVPWFPGPLGAGLFHGWWMDVQMDGSSTAGVPVPAIPAPEPVLSAFRNLVQATKLDAGVNSPQNFLARARALSLGAGHSSTTGTSVGQAVKGGPMMRQALSPPCTQRQSLELRFFESLPPRADRPSPTPISLSAISPETSPQPPPNRQINSSIPLAAACSSPIQSPDPVRCRCRRALVLVVSELPSPRRAVPCRAIVHSDSGLAASWHPSRPQWKIHRCQ
ncbi:hypothetical protein G7046_g5375 [Stylonectria norvegica]|nr:hypothetical protein G7046_g5375 [Stylonectria norvegica]